MELGSWFQFLIYRWEHWGPRSHRRLPALSLAHVQLCHTIALCRKSKRLWGLQLSHNPLGFFLSISVQHLSLNSEEELPLGKEKRAFPLPRQKPELFNSSDHLGEEPVLSGISSGQATVLKAIWKDTATEWTDQSAFCSAKEQQWRRILGEMA